MAKKTISIKNVSIEWTINQHGDDEGCVMFVQGVSMRCPLCGVLVESGHKHECDGRSNWPGLPQKAVRRKRAR